VITAIIVVATTYFTIRNFKTSTDSQERIAASRNETELQKAKSEALSKNRQEWINTLRNNVSEYISAAMAIWDLHQLRKGLDPHQDHLDKEQVVMNGMVI
jgi:DNA-nicking Smr family endonuclease